MHPPSRLGKKTLQTCTSKHSLSFHLSAFEATFIRTSNPALCRQKEIRVYTAQKLYTNDALSSIFFQPIRCSAFSNSRSFSYTLYSDDFS